MNRAETGRRGEAAAARWYQKQGAQLLAHNYHTRMGELDLVLREPDGTIVICEVKTRSQGMLQRPAAAVDPAKQHRLICAAQGYLQQTGQSEEPVRFDVAEVVPLDSLIMDESAGLHYGSRTLLDAVKRIKPDAHLFMPAFSNSSL